VAKAQPGQGPKIVAAKKAVPILPRGDKLVLVGLGNPGPEYDNTRHNVGFSVVSEFASRNGAPAFKHDRRFKAELATVRSAGKTIYVVRPRTYMNNSGQAVQAVMSYYNIPLSAVLVVADDMALELGRLRLRGKGSAGGHNGLRSIEKHVGGMQYPRLKVGVGEPRGGAGKWSDHVLGRFSRGDQKVLDDVMWDSMDILEEWVREDDVGKIMNAFTNKKNLASK
jgi:peptidyl-tRNA hydrolase, PTH1 family